MPLEQNIYEPHLNEDESPSPEEQKQFGEFTYHMIQFLNNSNILYNRVSFSFVPKDKTKNSNCQFEVTVEGLSKIVLDPDDQYFLNFSRGMTSAVNADAMMARSYFTYSNNTRNLTARYTRI